ncbi:hypothetical protein MTO96_038000, partial [Rhipicephalus appendiculatus]
MNWNDNFTNVADNDPINNDFEEDRFNILTNPLEADILNRCTLIGYAGADGNLIDISPDDRGNRAGYPGGIDLRNEPPYDMGNVMHSYMDIAVNKQAELASSFGADVDRNDDVMTENIILLAVQDAIKSEQKRIFAGENATIGENEDREKAIVANIEETVALNDPILDNMMTVVCAERWRKIRPAASPAFTAGKLRKMNGIIHDCARELRQNSLVGLAEGGRDLHPKEFFGHYALDVITRCVLGARLGSHTAQADEFVAKSQAAFSVKPNPALVIFFYIWTLFPFMTTLLRLQVFIPETFTFLKNFCVNVIEKRKLSSEKHQDFLQLMVDAQDVRMPAEGPLDSEEMLYSPGAVQAVESTK